MARREFDEMMFKSLKSQFEKDIRAAAAQKTEAEQNQRLDVLFQSYRAGQEKLEVICRRYVTNDFTVEKLQELLIENPNGLLVFRDELSGLFDMMNKNGHENDRPFFLEGWDGNNSYNTDRIGRGSKRIPRVVLSIFGGMTPATLQNHLSSDAFRQNQADGLIQRFQAAVWPDDVPWKNVDRAPDAEAEASVLALFKQIDEFTAPDTIKRIRTCPPSTSIRPRRKFSTGGAISLNCACAPDPNSRIILRSFRISRSIAVDADAGADLLLYQPARQAPAGYRHRYRVNPAGHQVVRAF